MKRYVQGWVAALLLGHPANLLAQTALPANRPPPPRGPELSPPLNPLERERHAANAALAMMRDYLAPSVTEILDPFEPLIGVGNELLWDPPGRIEGAPPQALGWAER